MSTTGETPAVETDSMVRAALHTARQHYQAGRFPQAEAMCRQVLQKQPDNADALHLLGLIAYNTGQKHTAIELISKAITVNPNNPEAQNDLGKALRAHGRLNEAIVHFEKALALKPGYAGAHINLGNALHKLGRMDEAISCYRKLLTLEPDNALAHMNLGNVLQLQGKSEEATVCYQNVIAIKPDHFEAHHNLGIALQAQGRHDQALSHYQKAIAFKPDYAEAYNHSGMVLRLLGRLEEAKLCHERALALKPDYAESLSNLGIVFKEQDRFEEAIACYQRAITLKPKLAETYNNLANALSARGELDETIKFYQTALALKPDYVDAHWNLSIVLLAKRDFSRGWPQHEWRWKTKDNRYLRHDFVQPWWDGRDPAGKTLLLWGEQGIGDEVLYAGLVRDVIARGARVILECAPRLIPLFTRSFPEATIIARSDPPHPIAHSADLQSPTGNLGRWLRPDMDSFHHHDGYLIADADLVARLRNRYQALGRGKRVVGISWRSGNVQVGRFRSIALHEWAPVLTLENITFVNLQYGDSSGELHAIQRQLGIDICQDAEIEPLQNLDAFAAQIAAMDLVISVDNSTVHFAGALGKPAWNILPKGQGLIWYWSTESETSLWYPSMRLFRQDHGGGWSTPMQRIARALHEFCCT